MIMFEWIFGKKKKENVSEIKKSFELVKNDVNTIGKWIKHLDTTDKQLFDVVEQLKQDLSSIKDEMAGLREGIDLVSETVQNKQLLEKTAFYSKQTAVGGVEKDVQTAVQTGNFYGILRGLSANERLIVFTLMNSDLKLSYEDLALLLGKERSTVRGQVNAIKQKNEGLIEELTEKNGKKRVFIPEETRQKLSKYAKVRVKGKKKANKSELLEEEVTQNEKSES